MRENTRGYRRKTVNLHVELVSDVDDGSLDSDGIDEGSLDLDDTEDSITDLRSGCCCWRLLLLFLTSTAGARIGHSLFISLLLKYLEEQLV
jgi:hypothetical protein